MTERPTEITLSIGAEPTTDDQELAELTQHLREDLLETGADSVKQVYGGEAPAGTKGDAVTLATLAVTLAPTALTGVIAILKSWLTRHERTSLTLQKGNRKITVTGTISKEHEKVIAGWLKKAS